LKSQGVALGGIQGCDGHCFACFFFSLLVLAKSIAITHCSDARTLSTQALPQTVSSVKAICSSLLVKFSTSDKMLACTSPTDKKMQFELPFKSDFFLA